LSRVRAGFFNSRESRGELEEEIYEIEENEWIL